MENYQFVLIDFCASDYFGGHHLPVIAVPVSSNMTAKEVRDGIETELNACSDLYESYNDEHISKALANFPENDEIYVKYEPEADEDEDEDFIEYPYLYFVVGRIENDRIFPGMKYAVYP